MDAKSIFLKFEDIEECYAACCMYFKRKSICVLKNTYGHHPLGQKHPPCIMKALSGTFLIPYFLDLHISVVYQIESIFSDKTIHIVK